MNMYLLDDEQRAKFDVLDKLFVSLTSEELKDLFGSDLIVAKLKGVDTDKIGPFEEMRRMMVETSVSMNISSLKVTDLENKLKELVRCINDGHGDATKAGSFRTLKNSLGVF